MIAVLLLAACSTPDPRKDDTPTSGHVLLLADEDLRPLVEAEAYMFQALYTTAELDIRYLPEAQLLKAAANDSVRCLIATTATGADQEAYYAGRRIAVHTIPIATDGVAVIVNPARGLSRLDRQQIARILDGKAAPTSWSALEPGAPDVPVLPLCAGSGSGVARMLADSVLAGNGHLNASALPSVQEVVQRVAADPRCMGFIPFAAISDLDDPAMRALRAPVKLLPVAYGPERPAVLPSQSTLADGGYPLRRPVYMLLVEGKSGLGTGFVSFVANHKGQRIILKLGLAPHQVPARDVEIVHE